MPPRLALRPILLTGPVAGLIAAGLVAGLVAGLLAVLLAGVGCRTTAPAIGRSADTEHFLARLSIEKKAAQLVFVPARGVPMHPDSPELRELERLVAEVGVGGLVLFDSDLDSIPPLIRRLQDQAEVRLLVASDLEAGLAFRVRRGSVALPSAMAIGATRSVAAARFAGELTAREAQAVGIDWLFAPVVDVNNNPNNPVIGIRSFGEDPALVAELGVAFLEGARSRGVLTTAKHFPGHGYTTVDSHEALPVLQADRERLDAVELRPFRALIAAGVDSVMVGHLAVPALDGTGTPSSLSGPIIGDLLRRHLGFDGLVVTDALDMKSVAGFWPGGAAVRAIAAGADVVLMPGDPRVAVQSIVRAVVEGSLTEERIDRSLRRLLAAKRRASDRHEAESDEPGRAAAIGRPEDLAQARAIAEASITLVRDRKDRLPLHAERVRSLLHLVLQDAPARASRATVAAEAIASRLPATTTFDVPIEISTALREAILAAAETAEEVVVSTASRDGELPADQRRLIADLSLVGPPPILLALTSPYVLGSVPDVPAYLCAYGAWPVSQRAVVAALFGEIDLRGRLPVTLTATATTTSTSTRTDPPSASTDGAPNAIHPARAPAPSPAPPPATVLHPFGAGLQRDARPMTIELVSRSLPAIDRIVASFIAEGAFPGAVVAAARSGKVLHRRGYGRQTYDPASAAIAADTIYDLASLTKVIATTTMAMILVDEGRIALDTPVQDVLPRFQGPMKERVTVRHLLTHSSGIDWWAPLYEELSGPEAYVERIEAMDLVYEPGTKTLYSDLGLILLGEILERAAGESLESFVERRVFRPLGMDDTGFNPRPALRARIAPTEFDADWRGRLLHGEVHDENASALGGVAPHAGLFSTADDLIRFGQMITNGGVYAHHRIVHRETIEEFTRSAGVVPGSTRALGWDTKSSTGSSAGTLFSPSSFGHTGFTGTSIWFDPERKLFLIILTNRVHPTRDKPLIRDARPAIADALIRSQER